MCQCWIHEASTVTTEGTTYHRTIASQHWMGETINRSIGDDGYIHDRCIDKWLDRQIKRWLRHRYKCNLLDTILGIDSHDCKIGYLHYLTSASRGFRNASGVSQSKSEGLSMREASADKKRWVEKSNFNTEVEKIFYWLHQFQHYAHSKNRCWASRIPVKSTHKIHYLEPLKS